MEEKRKSTTEGLFDEMLDRIRSGQWKIGEAIPSERQLMEEFGVSRIPLRESLSMLRALGVLDTGHGRKSIVRQIDANMLGRLFPLMLSMESEQTYEHVFEMRLTLESRTAYLAALRRDEDDLARLEELLATFRRQVELGIAESIETDLEFHLQIARSTKNPLFPLLLSPLASYVTYVQAEVLKNAPNRRLRALEYHEVITEAIRDQDPDRARGEMETHMRYSAHRVMKHGVPAHLQPAAAAE